MTGVLAAVAGIVFAVGLIISDMNSPSRIAKQPLRYAPTETAIDKRLVGGAAIFGVGWGLSGYCPGPALVSIGSTIETGLVVAAMIAGTAIARRFTR